MEEYEDWNIKLQGQMEITDFIPDPNEICNDICKYKDIIEDTELLKEVCDICTVKKFNLHGDKNVTRKVTEK